MASEIGDNLKRYRLLNNMSLAQVATKLNLTAPAINKYEKGEIIPDSERLLEFSSLYNVPTSKLIKAYNISKMKFTDFRKNQKLTGNNLELLQNIIQNEVNKYLEVLELSGVFFDNVLKKYSYSCNELQDAENAAISFRKKINVSSMFPITNITGFLENLGICIIYIDDIDGKFKDFDGLAEIVNNIPVIVLLKDQNSFRTRFTIAHELAHLVLKFPKEISRKEKEKLCHRFASSFLMPSDSMIKEFGVSRKYIKLYELRVVCEKYQVSIDALIYRLKDLSIINENSFRKWNEIIRNNRKKGNNFGIEELFKEESTKFNKMVCKLEVNSIISVKKASDYIGVTTDEYERQYNIN